MEEVNNFVTRKECSLIDERVKETIKGMEGRAKIVLDNFDIRLSDVENTQKDIHNLTLSVSKLADSVAAMLEKQKEQKEDIDGITKRVNTMENRDGEKWRTVGMFIITFSLGIILSFIAFKIGLSQS